MFLLCCFPVLSLLERIRTERDCRLHKGFAFEHRVFRASQGICSNNTRKFILLVSRQYRQYWFNKQNSRSHKNWTYKKKKKTIHEKKGIIVYLLYPSHCTHLAAHISTLGNKLCLNSHILTSKKSKSCQKK